MKDPVDEQDQHDPKQYERDQDLRAYAQQDGLNNPRRDVYSAPAWREV
jgi:hypothetical protein